MADAPAAPGKAPRSMPPAEVECWLQERVVLLSPVQNVWTDEHTEALKAVRAQMAKVGLDVVVADRNLLIARVHLEVLPGSPMTAEVLANGFNNFMKRLQDRNLFNPTLVNYQLALTGRAVDGEMPVVTPAIAYSEPADADVFLAMLKYVARAHVNRMVQPVAGAVEGDTPMEE